MILRSFLHSDRIPISYLLGCGGRARAAVLDPVGPPDAYLTEAEQLGMRIVCFRSAARLRGLPDHVEVLPGAFAGSVCGRGLSGKPFSTIGFERRYNRAFRVTDESAFVALMLQDIPPPPPGASDIRAANMGVGPAHARG